MKTFLVMFCLLLLVGCASKMEAPVTDNYSNLPVMQQIKVTPSVAAFPKAKVVQENGVEYMAFTAEEGDQILAYRNASKNNREALEHVVAAHNNSVAERNLLASALQLEESRKNAMAQAYADAENGRRYEQQTRLIETAVYKVLLLVIGAAAL